MTENMISELIRTMDGMYRLMSLQQTFLDRAAERLQDGNREIQEYQEMLEERDREIEEYQEIVREKDQKIQELWEETGSYQRLNIRLNEENESLKKQNQELLNLKKG